MVKMLSQHKIIIIVGVAIVALIAWYSLSSSSSSPEPLLTTTTADSGDQELLQSLETLKAINLDTTIFSNPAYLSLKDFSTQIVLEPIGRSDPFAPLSVSVAPTSASTKSAQIFKSPQ